MNILALESSTGAGSVALARQGVVTEEHCDSPRDQSKVILSMVDRLLKSSGLSPSDLDLIALTNGPGSFTGIRICISVAQGLAYAARLPSVTLSTLESMALQASVSLELPPGETIVVLLDARMQELYWAVYQLGLEGCMNQIYAPRVSSITELFVELDKLSGPSTCVGSGIKYIEKERFVGFTWVENFEPKASGIVRHIQQKLAKGLQLETLAPGELIEPLYLRNEVAWQKRKRIRTESESLE